MESFLCPITLCIMEEPYVDKYGFSYEKDAIMQWLDNHNTSPLNKQPLRKSELFPNRALKISIDEYRNKTEPTNSTDSLQSDNGQNNARNDATSSINSNISDNLQRNDNQN